MSNQMLQEISSAGRIVKAPVISVALLVYNHEQYIAQALEGIISQKINFPVEIVAAEDCSTDSSRKILEDYQIRYPHLMRILVSPTNVGMHANSERLLQACRGQYVAMLEGDDYWIDPEKLAIQKEYMDRYPNCAVSTHNMNVLCPDGTLNIFRMDSNKTTYNLEEALEDFTVPTASIIIPRDHLPLPFPSWTCDLPGLAGYLVYHAMKASGGHMKFFPQAMGVYRMHPGGVHSHLTNLRKNQNGLRGREILQKNMFPKSRALARLIRQFAINVFQNLMMDRSYGEARAVARQYLWKTAWCNPKDLYLCLSAYLPFLFDFALRTKLEKPKVATPENTPV